MTATNAGYCKLGFRKDQSAVGLSACLVSPAKTAEPIEMPFGLRTWVGPGNHVLDEGSDPPWELVFFFGGGDGRPIV